MVDAAPFTALRYDPAVAGDPASTSAPAYDLIEPLAYAQHRTASPYTVLELLAPDGAYARSGQLLERWRRNGVLVTDGPALFRYEQHELLAGARLHTQRGVLAAVRIETPGKGSILPHEEVDEARVRARLRRLEAVPAELDPVYMVLEDPPAELSRLLTTMPETPPVVAASDEAGVDHRIWAWRDPETHAELARLLGTTRAIIADGHHRYARSLAWRDRCRQRGGDVDGEAPWERVLAYLVDPVAGSPRLEAMHRMLMPVSAAQLEVLREDFDFEETSSDPGEIVSRLHAAPGRAFGLVGPGPRAFLLHSRDDAALRDQLPPGHSKSWATLDAAVLTHAVLPRLGLAPHAVRYRADVETCVGEVARADDAALVLLRPAPMETVLKLASAGERLPYKSTRFLPKPRTGLLMRPVDGDSAH